MKRIILSSTDVNHGIVKAKGNEMLGKPGFTIAVSNKMFNELIRELNATVIQCDMTTSGLILNATGTFTINGNKVEYVFYENTLFVFEPSVREHVVDVIRRVQKKFDTSERKMILLRYPIVTPYGVKFNTRYISKEDIQNDIYPWLFKFSRDQNNRPFNPFEFGKNWKNQGNLAIIHGEPGSGKSKSILWVGFGLKEQDDKGTEIIVITPSVINKLGDFVMEAIADESTDYIFVIDDFDKLGGRFIRGENETVTSIISLLLQSTDSIIPIKNIKFLITSNRKISEIDKALLRPGRLYRRLELSLRSFNDVTNGEIELSNDVVKEYREFFDTDFDYNKPLTLVEWKFLVDRVPELKNFV